MKDYFVDGERIDGVLGVPVEMVSCPGCGKKYRRGTYVCANCQECKSCHTCKEPELVKVDDDFLLEIAGLKQDDYDDE
jgi:hypothetical protein